MGPRDRISACAVHSRWGIQSVTALSEATRYVTEAR
jgi:hypothetical protein